ncbi:flippase [Desulfococcaceae bacterium HSG9]|nr:flippase [Desulfococcaceae bacterium HSG9]
MTTHSKSILKNTFFLVTGRLISRILQFFLFIYAARRLGVNNFGIFSYGFALVYLFSIFMDLGISTYSVQQVSRDHSKTPQYLGAILLSKLILTILSILLIIATGLIMHRDATTLWVLFILGSCVALDNLGGSFNAVFQAHEKMHYEAIIISFSNLIMSVVGFAILYYSPGILLFCLVYTFGATLRASSACVWCLKKYDRPIFSLDIEFIYELFRKGLPFALVMIFIHIYGYIDTLILAAYCENEIVGYYNAAYRLVEAPLFIIQSLSTAIFPALSRLYVQDKTQLAGIVQQFFQKAVALGLSISLVVAILSEDLIKLIYGKEYEPAAAVLPILIFSIAIIMPNTICGSTIRAIDRQTISAKVTGLGAILNVVLNLILIPSFSLLGAAWATIVTELFVLVVQVVLIWKYVGPVMNWKTLGRIVGLNAIIIGFLFISRSLGIWFQICGITILFLPLTVLTGVITMEELKRYLPVKL